MEKYFRPLRTHQDTKGVKGHKPEMCDHQEKDRKHGKNANSKIPQMKHHHQNQGHHHRQKSHQSDDNDSHDTHSTADDSLFSDLPSGHQHQHDEDKTHHPHSHHYHRKQNHRHVSLSEAPSSSSTASSSSSSSSHSTSSSSVSSSSSSSSPSSSSSSSSSSSFSSSSSTSSSSLSSNSSSDCSDRHPLKKAQHSQSCTDISGKHKHFEEEDDTVPLIDKRGYQNRLSAKQKQEKGKSSHSGPTKGTKNRATRGSGYDGSVRKSKSMEALTGPKEKDWHENEDENEQERRKSEAKKNLMKEKMKFSAFLNEITRQVLSPMRLTTLGVTDAQRPCSPGQASVRSSKGDSSTEKHSQPRSRHDTAESVCSSKYSHTSKDSSQPSHSKSSHQRQRHRSTGSPHRTGHRSCTDVRCLKRSQSWSQASQHRSHSPSYEHNHHRHQGDDHASSHHHLHGDRNSPCYNHHHRDHHNTSHHHHHGHHHSPLYHHGDHHNKSHHHRDHKDTSYHYYHGDHHHGDHRHHGSHHSPSHHRHHEDHHITTPRKGHHTPTHYYEEHHSSGHRRHSDHPTIERPTTPRHHGRQSLTSDTIYHHHGDHHSEPHHHHYHHHRDHHSEPHHHHHHRHHHQIPGHHHHYGNKHNESQQHHHGDHHSELHHHQHGEHHNSGHQHHCDEHHSESHHHHHGDHHSPSHQHHHDDHHSQGHQHQHHHGDHHGESHHHHHGDHHSPGHQHHHDGHHSSGHQHHHDGHHSSGHQHHHGDHHSSAHEHQHGDHHSTGHQHHHGDHHSPGHQHQHENHHGSGHQHHHSPGHQHHHDDHHSPGHQHHHDDHHSTGHQHHHDDHHSPGHQHQHEDHHSPGHQHHHSPGHQHHHDDHHSPGHQHHHGDHHSPSHQHGDSHHNQPHTKNNNLGHDGHHAGSPPLPKKLESLSSKANSSRNTSSPSSQDEEQTSFIGPSSDKEKPHELGRIMVLQEQNEGLHQTLLKTAVRMECLGEEFMSNQKLLEAELQRTRMELSSLTERFGRLHDNCSSTQQTNSLLEQRLHSVAQSMEGERERLNRRISALTKQLADAKYANSVETFNVTSVLHKTELHFQTDDAMNQVVPPIAPPPAEFMDNHTYEKAKAGGQEQPLGSVPEEEESDWSELGDETPRFILTGSNRVPVWRHREADDKDSESGGEEILRRHYPRPLQIPHLQFTMHNENLSDGTAGEDTFRISTSPNHGSAILIRSASLEEIPLARHHMQKELRGTEAMMDLHHQGGEATGDLDNEIIHHWRTNNDRDAAMVRLSRTSEADSSLTGLQSAERMFNHFMCGAQPAEGQGQGRAEVHSWTGGIPDELLKGERTQL
uniref:LIM domain-containing protein A isoform X2 n=1 Tax=Epinephelus lanceolatus TaxID=310571 RepID=UPI001448A05D|nr:LIM domain-containing protein A isoform X2 [Epinephelus lanceolatus]